MFNKDLNPTNPARETTSREEPRAVEPEKPKVPKGQNPNKFRDVLGPEDRAKKVLKNGNTVSFEDDEDEESKPSLFGLAGLPTTRQLAQAGEQGAGSSGLTDEDETLQDPATAEALMQGNIKPVGTSSTLKTPASASLNTQLPEVPLDPKKAVDPKLGKGVEDDLGNAHLEKPHLAKADIPLDPRSLDHILDSKKGEILGTKTDKEPEIKLDPSQILPQGQKIPTDAVQITAPDLDAASRELSRLRTHELQAIVRQIVDAVTTISSTDLTTTLITLKHPPIFEGATLQVTEFDTAKNQFNITFDKLSPEARRLIESTENQSVLRQNLIDRGYTLQMVTIETDLKPINLAEGARADAQYTRNQKGDEGQEQGEEQDHRFA